MLQAAGATRAAWRHVTEHAGIDSPSQVARYRREVEAARRARGLAGPDAPPWPLDPLPVVIGEPEWDELAEIGRASCRERAAEREDSRSRRKKDKPGEKG